MDMNIAQDKKLMARSPNMEDELDFEKIKEKTKKSRQELIISEKPMSAAELKSLPLYVNDIVRYVDKYASQGKEQLDYDCSKLSKACFLEISHTFKQKYPLFFLVMSLKTQILTINWSGKSEA